MFNEIVFNKTSIPATLKSLDAAMLRSRVIANNIANLTTPGYQRLDVQFEDQFRQALDQNALQGTRTCQKHLQLGRPDLATINPVVEKSNDETMPGGINNVDIDEEMAKLAETQILFNFGARFVRDRIKTINASIKGSVIQ